MCLVNEHLLRVSDLDLLPSLLLHLSAIARWRLRSCGWRRSCIGRRCAPGRHHLAVIFHDAVQRIDQILIVICSFLCRLLDIVDILLQRIQTLEQDIDHSGLNLKSPIPDLRKYVLHIMGKRLHPLIAHRTSHTL